jgi:DNA-binding MarR family transcriptional regulator
MTTGPMRDIERELVVLVRRVRRTTAENARRLHPDLLPSAYPVLVHIADHEPTRACDVVDQVGMDKGGVSRQIAHLEQLGLVRRGSDPADRRAQTLVLTENGRARFERLTAQRRTDFEQRLSAWSPEELASFAEQLARYNACLEPEQNQGHEQETLTTTA